MSPKDAPKPFRSMPRPSALPLIGLLPGMRRDPLATLELVQAAGEGIARLPLGPMSGVLVTDPTLLQQVLIERSKIYGMAPFFRDKLSPVIGGGLTVAEGARWKRNRRILQPFFMGGMLKTMVSHFDETMRDQIRAFDEAAATGRLIDVALEARRITLQNAFRALFSDSFDPTLLEHFAAVGDVTGERFWHLTSITHKFPTASNRRYEHSMGMIREYVRLLIQRRRSSPREAADLADCVINARDPDSGELWTDEEIRDELVTVAFGGYDTTACLLTWSMLCMASAPEATVPMREEADRLLVDADVAPTDAVLEGFPRTRSFISEVLRLYPPVWLMVRHSKQPDVLGGYEIPPGTTIFASPHVTHRDAALWAHPGRFDPSRFDAHDGARPRMAYFPFGAGPRHCLGYQFALAEAVGVLSAIARRYEFEFVDGRGLPRQRPGVMNWPDGRVLLKIKRRR